MFYIILAILALAFIVVLKIVKGVLKLILALILIGLLIGAFAGRDHIETTAPAPTSAVL